VRPSRRTSSFLGFRSQVQVPANVFDNPTAASKLQTGASHTNQPVSGRIETVSRFKSNPCERNILESKIGEGGGGPHATNLTAEGRLPAFHADHREAQAKQQKAVRTAKKPGPPQ
jgi:hypothetical protein